MPIVGFSLPIDINSVPSLWTVDLLLIEYSSVLNRQPFTFISGKVCLLASIRVKRQTLPEINVLFRTLVYWGKLCLSRLLTIDNRQNKSNFNAKLFKRTKGQGLFYNHFKEPLDMLTHPWTEVTLMYSYPQKLQ